MEMVHIKILLSIFKYYHHFFFPFRTESYVAQAGFQLARRLALNSGSSCLSLQSSEIIAPNSDYRSEHTLMCKCSYLFSVLWGKEWRQSLPQPRWPWIKDDLVFLVLLPLPPQCWDFWGVPPDLVLCGLGIETGFMNARQVLYQLSYSPTSIYLFLLKQFAIELSRI